MARRSDETTRYTAMDPYGSKEDRMADHVAANDRFNQYYQTESHAQGRRGSHDLRYLEQKIRALEESNQRLKHENHISVDNIVDIEKRLSIIEGALISKSDTRRQRKPKVKEQHESIF